MKILFKLFIVLLTGNLGEAFYNAIGSGSNGWGNDICNKPLDWTQLTIRYCDKPYNTSSVCFEKMPVTTIEAEISGWRKISSECSNGGRYAGYIYIFKNDLSVSLIYDANGVIAGIQTNMVASLLKSCKSERFRYKFNEVPYFLLNNFKGEEYLTVTAYFVDPGTICCSGRSLSQYHKREFKVNGIWYQKGPNPSFVEHVPPFRSEAVKKNWLKGQCVDAMGYHNFKDMNLWEQNDCLKNPPVDTIFNNQGQLHGFAFIVLGTAQNSTRYEHPKSEVVQAVMNGPACPKCVKPFIDACGFTRLHVFFSPKPTNHLCPPGLSVH